MAITRLPLQCDIHTFFDSITFLSRTFPSSDIIGRRLKDSDALWLSGVDRGEFHLGETVSGRPGRLCPSQRVSQLSREHLPF